MIFILTGDKKDSKDTQSEEVLIVEENVEEVEENIEIIESNEIEESIQEGESIVEYCEEENEDGEIIVEPLSTYIE